MKPNISSRLGTDTPLLKDLITGIKRGEIKVPQFQRRFVWKDEQALNLLDHCEQLSCGKSSSLENKQ